VREQLRENPVAKRARQSNYHRALRAFFHIGTFGRFLAVYLAIDLLAVGTELLSARFAPDWLPSWSSSGSTDTKALILNVSSYFITAQGGALGMISIALALVTIIAQRENSSTDVQLYYYESLSFEIVASCVALLAVLCAQLLWPFQFLLHRLGGGTELQIFKLLLLGVHTAWLIVNLAAVAHFVATTFRFVQQSAREDLRERFTVNLVMPRAMTRRLREQMYYLAGAEMLSANSSDDEDRRSRREPSVSMGMDLGSNHGAAEIVGDFTKPVVLFDVRVTLVRWVARRWARRCETANAVEMNWKGRRGRADKPLWIFDWLSRIWRSRGARSNEMESSGWRDMDRPTLIFTPDLDQTLRGKVAWCRRNGGVPLKPVERFILRRAFRFQRQRDAE
jgi:hypothetical protein